jgi:hypothetical protein
MIPIPLTPQQIVELRPPGPFTIFIGSHPATKQLVFCYQPGTLIPQDQEVDLGNGIKVSVKAALGGIHTHESQTVVYLGPGQTQGKGWYCLK